MTKIRSMSDVLIVGGGVIGLCTAWSCLKRGLSVTVMDIQSGPGAGCSYGNAGMIVPSHVVPLAAPGMIGLGLKWMLNPESPFAIRPRLSWDLLRWGYQFWTFCNPRHVQQAAPILRDLNLASRALYRELAEQWGNEFGLVQRGMLMLCETQQGLDEEAHAAEQARALGLAAEVLNREQIAVLEPQTRMHIAGGVRFPEDCHLDPRRFLEGLHRRLVAAGCRFVWDADFEGCFPGEVGTAIEEAVLQQSSRTQTVLAAGVWTEHMLRKLKVRLPLLPGKGYSLTLPQARTPLQHCAIAVEGRIAITPMGEGLRVGGTMELGAGEQGIARRRVEGIIKTFCRLFPEYTPGDFANIQPWSGLRPCSPDGLPYIGRTRVAQNVVIATGHAMMGLSLGPITGELVAQLVAGETPSLPIDRLSPDRFL